MVDFPFRVFFIYSISFLMFLKSSALLWLGCFVRLELDCSICLELSSLLLVGGLWPSLLTLFQWHWQGLGILLFSWERRCLNSSFCLVNSLALVDSVWICWIIWIGSSGVETWIHCVVWMVELRKSIWFRSTIPTNDTKLMKPKMVVSWWPR